MQVDISSLIVAVTGLGALLWSVVQSRRGRKDTKEQQSAANELATREQSWEELKESKQIMDEDLRNERGHVRELRSENAELHREIRKRDELIARHRPWDIEVSRRLPDVGDPPQLYP